MGGPRLERVFRFSNFADAVVFSNRTAAVAEDEDLHLGILTERERDSYAVDARHSFGYRFHRAAAACPASASRASPLTVAENIGSSVNMTTGL